MLTRDTRIRTNRADNGVSEIEAVVKVPFKGICFTFGIVVNRFSTVSCQFPKNIIVIVVKARRVMRVKQSCKSKDR